MYQTFLGISIFTIILVLWFIALLILNTVSILELIYIFKIAKKNWPEVKKDFHNAWKSIK